MRITQVTLLSLAALLPTSYAQSQSAQKLPPIVQQELASMAQMCKEVGGKPSNSPDLLSIADLTGDGLADFVIDQGAFVCNGAASLFSGSGGSQMSVFVATPGGQAAKAFDSGTFGVKVDKSKSPSRVIVMVGGALCGQKVTPNTSRVEMKPCWRPVEWNETTRKMQFAPLSRIQPVQ